jgi:hypothetical protein
MSILGILSIVGTACGVSASVIGRAVDSRYRARLERETAAEAEAYRESQRRDGYS